MFIWGNDKNCEDSFYTVFFYVNNSGPDLQIKWIRPFHLQCVCVNNVKLILFIGMPKVKAKAGSMMKDSFTEGADAFWGFSPEEQEQLKETPPFHNPVDLISCELLHFGTKISAQLKPVLILTAFLIVFTRFYFQSGFSCPSVLKQATNLPIWCCSPWSVRQLWESHFRIIFSYNYSQWRTNICILISATMGQTGNQKCQASGRDALSCFLSSFLGGESLLLSAWWCLVIVLMVLITLCCHGHEPGMRLFHPAGLYPAFAITLKHLIGSWIWLFFLFTLKYKNHLTTIYTFPWKQSVCGHTLACISTRAAVPFLH